MVKFTKKIVENSENFLIKKFITQFKRKIKNSGKERFSFVLTGGKSPIKLYKNLAKEKNIPWRNIDFFFGDERCVNKNSKDSNINMCKKNLLKKIPILNSQIYEINIKNTKLKNIAREYEKKIRKYFNGKKICFDLTLLGVGNDGHIASLFKNNINTPKFFTHSYDIKNEDLIKKIKKKLRFPVVVMPLNEGSSASLKQSAFAAMTCISGPP